MNHLPKHPIRAIVAASSGGGKTYVMIEMILQQYRGVWDKIYVFSPSATVDRQWEPVKDYVKRHLRQKEEPFHEDFDSELVEELLAQQHHEVQSAKHPSPPHPLCQDNPNLRGPRALFIFDDVTDQGSKVRNLKPLLALFTRGRHLNCSVLLSTQRYRFCPPEARLNQTALIVGSLRSDADWQAIKEELSRKIPPERLDAAYEMCVEGEKHGWLLLQLDKKKSDPDQILCGWDKRVLFQ
jgi:hypothetical protein